ncbi:hypothetical protein PLICRDRAFT_107096 [Plicaturopsis crispa FD-325 SS-3]|nr:hypothetical protein PLICRDRAFT_107096 [Plicaturopsis crispa FD-325 SS-3]
MHNGVSSEDGAVGGETVAANLSALSSTAEDTLAGVSPSQEKDFRRKMILHFSALAFSMFLEGWNDSTIGPLLPSYQEFYHVGFAVVSMLFVLTCVGFLTGACANVYLSDKLGFGKSLAASVQLVAYVIQSTACPFPVMVVANAFSGFGVAIQNAHANAFVASTKGRSFTKLGLLHASYGVGALVAPLVATSFSTTRHWWFHYLVSLGFSVVNIAVLVSVFRFRQQDAVLAEAGMAPSETGTETTSKLRQIFGIRTVHFLALFCLLYVGVEVTVGGWIVTFIIKVRGGGPSAGYISSGFWAGITLGRVSLIWLNRKVGERRILFVYALLVIALEITVWMVPSLIENAVAVAIMGVLLGPMYPILVNHAMRILPAWLLAGAVGWIAGFGQAGSAIFPFFTGLIASKYGISSLQPTLVGMSGAMLLMWATVPKARRE